MLSALGEILLSPLYFFMQWLAEENVLFTTVKEGTAKAIRRGQSFERFLLSFRDYHLNVPDTDSYNPEKPAWEILYHGPNNKDGYKGEQARDDWYDRNRPNILKRLGLYWVGWPWSHNVYPYQFAWNEPYSADDGTEKVLARAEATDFVYVSDFTYVVVTKEAETGKGENVPVDVISFVTVAIRNPYRALFSGEDWMRRITGAINRHARDFVGLNTYEALIAGGAADEAAKRERWTRFSKPIIDLNDRLLDDSHPNAKPPFGLRGRYGVEIRTADLQSIEISGEGRKRAQDASTKKFEAQKEAEATRITGQAAADVIAMRGDKEAESLEKRLAIITSNGAYGIELARLDGMVGSGDKGNTIIWANNPFAPFAPFFAQPKKEDV